MLKYLGINLTKYIEDLFWRILQNSDEGWVQCLKPVILATQEAKVGKIVFPG
jgi:hypothetical protein